MLAKPADHRALDGIEIIGAAVAALARLLELRADYSQSTAMVAVLDRHASAAAAAAEQTGKRMARFDLPLGLYRGARCPPLLSGLEELVGNNTQFRHLGLLPLFIRIDAAYSLARVGITHHVDAVPDEMARIELIAHDPMAALGIAEDARRPPIVPAGRGNIFAVERRRNFARGVAAHIAFKDASYDIGLGNDDFEFPRFARHRAVSISSPAGATAFANNACHAAPGMQGEVLDEMLGHHGADTAVQSPDNATGRVDLHAQEFEPFARGMPVGLVAGDAVAGTPELATLWRLKNATPRNRVRGVGLNN